MQDTQTFHAGSPRLQAAAESVRTEAEARAARVHPQPESVLADFFDGLARAQSHLTATPYVYPFYLASRIKRCLSSVDPENIIASVGSVETVGDCRYAMTVTDTSGTQYRVRVEVLDSPRPSQAGEAA